NGMGKRQLWLAAAEQLRLLLRYERPGNGLDEASRRKRPPRLARAVLNHGEHRFARMFTGERRRRDAIDTDDAHDFLDDISAPVHIRTPRRHRHLHSLALAGSEKSKLLQQAADVRQRAFQ